MKYCRHISLFFSLVGLIVLAGCGREEIIKNVPVTKISVSPASLTLTEGETQTLKVQLEPENATDQKVQWIIDHPKVATVDDDGTVTAVHAGTATVRVAHPASGLAANCQITVKEKAEPEPEPGPEPEPEPGPEPEPEPEPGLDPTPVSYRVWEDTGADLPDYPTYKKVSTLADFPRIDITWTTPTQKIPGYEGEYTWVEGTVRFRDPKEMYRGANAETYETDSGVLQMKIRGRGNTTWNAEGGVKNPYKIKLAEHRKVFGMKGDKDWLLLADVQDPSVLRNAVALRIARMVSMPWTPKYRAAEVYFNGEYGGCYLLVEAKEVDRENKIPITVVESGKTDGGYLLEVDNKNDMDLYFNSKEFLRKIKFKDPEDPDAAQKKYITDYVNAVEKLLKDQAFDAQTGYRSMLDVETFIGNYIVHELTMNVDGGMRLSTYFAKDTDTKLFMPMVWDFDLSLGNCSYIGRDFDLPSYDGHRNGPEGWFIKIRGGDFRNGDVQGKTETYYQFLFKDPQFVQDLKIRWNLVKPRLDKIPAFIDKMVEYNSLAYDHNVQAGKNPRAKKSYYYPPDQFTSWSEAVDYMKDFYTKRLAWLDTAINGL